MKSQIFTLIAVFSASVFYSCGSLDYGKEKPTEILVQADEPNANFAWEQDVSYIMKIKCANCHGADHHPFAPEKAYTKFPYNFEDKDTFTKLAPLIKSVIFDEELRASKPEYAMPPNYGTPLSDLEKLAIKNYIEKKLPTAAVPPVATPGATPNPGSSNSTVKYADVKVYLEATCGGSGCHSGGLKSLFDSTSQAGASAKAVKAAERMQNSGSPMPGAGRVDSTPDGKKLLDWLKAGAP